ncbi:matrixin family metalloprotease [Nocardioides gilvus]|uniref:matrixin family metalloprotease n=1 Tax=Nocardioides gilvus TaxID=1735589 RepID=UPI000D74CBDD|nr:matrixin family metalloprotease [Nocardioides gilvus]
MVKWRVSVAGVLAGVVGLSGVALVAGVPVGAAASDAPVVSSPPTYGERTFVDAASKALRRNVQTKKKGKQTFTGPRSVQQAQRFTVTGSVPWARKVGGKRKVVLQLKTGRTWKSAAARKVGAKKRVTFIAKRTRTGTVAYRLVAPAVKNKRRVVAKRYTSPALRVKVVAKPKAAPTPTPTPTRAPTPFPAPVAPGPYDEHDHVADPWNPFSPTPAGAAWDWTTISAVGDPRWNPCDVITWDYNPTGSYAGSLRDMKKSFDRVSKVSGLRFRYVGVNPDDAVMEPAAEIKVQWKSLGGGTLGVANTRFYVRPTGYEIFESSIDLTLDYAFAPGLDATRNLYPYPAGVVMQHELMHAVGLGHASQDTQLMHPYVTPKGYRMGAGDLAGMRAVGSEQGCL